MNWSDIFIHDTYLSVDSSALSFATVSLCALMLGGLVYARWGTKGVGIGQTTLVGPWWWSIASVSAIAVVEGSLAIAGEGDRASAWRFVAATGVFCPVMSLLGAKRPQDKAWHFIVGSLWGMLALPAAEVLWLRPGQALAIVDFRAYFLIGLVGVSVLVLLPTRHWLAALLMGAGQLALVWSYLPHRQTEATALQILIGTALLLAALGGAFARGWRKQRPRYCYDRLWLDFRDAFGALWAARVLERVNAAASVAEWPVRLGWNGFHASGDAAVPQDIPPEIESQVRQTLSNLLRRFVSPQWMDERLS